MNIWMGVSIENESFKWRVDCLRRTEARFKFVSLEPLIGRVGRLNLEGIDWVIVGGESGAEARPIEPEWVLEIRDQCITSNVPFFFKQWGGVNKKLNGRVLEGRIWDQIPQAMDDTLSAATLIKGRQMEIAVGAPPDEISIPHARGSRLSLRQKL
jgi:protein gp37